MVTVYRSVILLVHLLLTGLSSIAQSKFKTYLNQAYASSDKGQHIAALTLLYKAQALKGIDTSYNESINLYIGDNYLAIGKIDSCIYYFDASVKYFEDCRDTGRLNYIFSRMGRGELGITKRYDKALAYFRRQVVYSVQQQDSTSFFHCLTNIGNAYKFLGQYDSALTYFIKVESNSSAQNAVKSVALRLIADTYSLLQQYKKAIGYYNQAIQAMTTAGDSINLFIAFLNKGDCLMQQQKFSESLTCFEQSERFDTDSIDDADKMILYENLAYVFGKTGDFEKAYYYKNLEAIIKDRINTNSIQQAAAEMEAKYEVRKNKDSLNISSQNLRLASKESEGRQRKFLIALVSAAAISLLLFLALRNATLRKKATTKLAVEKEKVEKLAGELEEANQTKARLFSVIGHDLRSPVSSLYASLKMQELKSGNGTTSAISNQMMQLLDTLEDLLIWSKSQMDKFNLQPVPITVHALYNDMVNLYSDIASGRQVTISNVASGHIKIYTDENLLKTILRNMLANAVAYAPEHSTVTMDAVQQDDIVVCKISNEATAAGYAAIQDKLDNTAVQSSKHGLGTVLVSEFMQQLRTTLHISYANGSVHLQFSLPAFRKSATPHIADIKEQVSG